MAAPSTFSMSQHGRTEPFDLQVARGQVPYHSLVNIQGYQASIPTSNFYPLWENATYYTYPGSATTMTLSSSSNNDTNVTITINGLDASYNILTENLVLTNGQTGVVTVNSYLRINSIVVAGSVNPVGTIYLANGNFSGKTVTYAQIGTVSNNGSTVSAGRSQMSLYTVPNGYSFFLNRAQAYTVNNGAQYNTYRVWSQNNGISNVVLTAPFAMNYTSTRIVPRAYSAKTDIQWQMANTNSGPCSIQVEGILILDNATSIGY